MSEQLIDEKHARTILEIGEGASEEELRKAYLRKVKAFPPDQAPEEFQRIKEAYDLLRAPKKRAVINLFEPNPKSKIADTLGIKELKPEFVGPKPWLSLLKKNDET